MNNITNQQPYLRTSRNFPAEIDRLVVELNKAYIDTAITVNNRVIGTFTINRSAITGESWFLSGNQRQATLRQVYQFTSTVAIPHGLNFSQFSGFSRLFGTYTDGTNWYGLIGGSNVAIAGQVSIYVDPTNINFLSGAGAPAVTKGTLVLEWLAFP